ncbi:2-C-methyl-D-erythritol 4-phosphate cytidylyltransferase [Mobilisporobacter senegalensis]|uniref:2-C-methyl-D-erythritol 4-phosphate cytidylyltransferase n=1 Tax=Mobilisporobacter senegalensis TaxID=1329262 RepID=A0A3N1X539_9FIRM|nr:2-C-methyl-D-erythritol 4-phosphate cytidylyltransferase [Mobilisporobacter senegalensis]ROR21894.1 2-C-methyl-D-erythritol 4-phosphate cytidylyltransferase [Mobilisporobacter senegalensis]
MGKDKITAVVLAAGQGKRMNSKIAKQYLMLKDKPVLYYSLRTFEDSIVDDIILVVGSGEIEYVRKHVIEAYQFKKVNHIIEGGKERYNSVYNALVSISNTNYVLIHDGARPFVTNEIVDRIIKNVIDTKACIAGMPVKDTIKISDKDGFVSDTPSRENVWMIQTPQAFEYELIKKAYDIIMKEENIHVTDDAMVLEYTLGNPIKLIEGSYQNIKITTPEDIKIGEMLLSDQG